MATVLLTACGSGSGSETTGAAPSEVQVKAPPIPKTIKGQLAQTFPKPKAVPGSPAGTESAIAAGRKACKGKKPVQVRDEFIAEAEAGLQEGQKAMVEEIGKFEAQAPHSASFAAGQLAAGVYEATLPEAQKTGGFQGCVYELALQLQRELAKK